MTCIFVLCHTFLICTDPQLLCRLLQNPLEPERIQEIITEAVDIEKEFIVDSLPVSDAHYDILLMLSA